MPTDYDDPITTPPSHVWIIETGDYDQRYVVAVAVSLTEAVRFIKDKYGLPYIVRWEDVVERVQDSPAAYMVGHFKEVAGCSTRHIAQYDFTLFALK